MSSTSEALSGLAHMDVAVGRAAPALGNVVFELDLLEGTVRLGRDELVLLAAGLEFERVVPEDRGRLVHALVSRRGWTWADMQDGAVGLRLEHATLSVTLGEALSFLEPFEVRFWLGSSRGSA